MPGAKDSVICKQTNNQTNSQTTKQMVRCPCGCCSLSHLSHACPITPTFPSCSGRITLRNRCWPTAFHTIPAGDVDGRCWDWPVWSTPHTKLSVRFRAWKCWGLRWGIDVGPPLSTLLQPGMSTYDVRTNRCVQPLMPRSHQTFRPVPAVEMLGTMIRIRCWPTVFHTIPAGYADRWCEN